MISYSEIKKIENISCEEISNNCNLHYTFHFILNKLVHVSIRWVYISRRCNCKTKNKHKLRAGTRKYKLKAGTVKHKLGTRTVKYKFGSETGAGASAGGRETQIPSELTHSKTMFLYNRNQSIDFHSKMIHCFLCESGIWTVVLNWSIKNENNELIWCLFLKFEWKFAHWKSIYI